MRKLKQTGMTQTSSFSPEAFFITPFENFTLAPFTISSTETSLNCTNTSALFYNGTCNNSGNGSEPTYPPVPTFTSASLTRTIMFGIMFLISFAGNMATLIQMRRLRRRKSTINTLIVNLALADLLITFFCIAGEAAWAATVQWLAGSFMCKFVKYMQGFALYLSTYITVAISLDRCVAIIDPMRRNGAAQRVRVMITFAWFFSALFSIPQPIIFNVQKGPFKEEFYQCVNFGVSGWQLQLYAIVSLLIMFILPLAVIGTAYALIFTTINRKSKEHSVMDSIQMPESRAWVTRWEHYKHYLCLAFCSKTISRRSSVTSNYSVDHSRGPVRSHLLRKAKRKSLIMSFVIVMAFLVCWTPYHIIFMLITFLNIVIDPIIITCFSFIGLSNSMLNPMIYGAFQLCKRRPAYNANFSPGEETPGAGRRQGCRAQIKTAFSIFSPPHLLAARRRGAQETDCSGTAATARSVTMPLKPRRFTSPCSTSNKEPITLVSDVAESSLQSTSLMEK